MDQKNQSQQADTEYSRCAVPLSERKSYFSLTIIWTGFVFVITSMMAGGGLASGLDRESVIHIYWECASCGELRKINRPGIRIFQILHSGSLIMYMLQILNFFIVQKPLAYLAVF
ncbi:hypothetical protein [Lacrimispora sp.]|uniref:hypothetical protein n=1 Tax=Lacrimispora sp. TaxID=2719234 RepID=UPI0028978B82|nr:hypothetical protein [Lacrimispora sp.]